MQGTGRAALTLIGSLVLLAALAWAPAVRAQACSADVQCPNGGRRTFACIGDTLVVRRSICSGTCREIEERRQDCGPRVIGTVTCAGNTAVRTEGGCNAALGICDRRIDRQVCVPSCDCRGNRLAVATGTCVSGSGCACTVLMCGNGCTCSPEPRCR